MNPCEKFSDTKKFPDGNMAEMCSIENVKIDQVR